MFANTINVSDRVANQLPEFIRNEDEQLINFLVEYYKSQEKTGRAYNVLNNILKYLDIDAYDQKTLTSSTVLIKDVDPTNDLIEVEQIDGFIPNNGSVMIDNEVIYYENTVRGPDAILTPGISLEEFNKKRQALESPWEFFDGTRRTFDLKFLGTPVSPVSAEHLAVTIYGDLLIPQVDYTISGSEIIFTEAPRARTGNDQVELTQILYYIGFADSIIKELVVPSVDDLQGQDSMTMQYENLEYAPIAEIGLIINRNGVLQRPYVDYVLTDNNTRIKYFINISTQDTFHIRSIEYVSPTVGQGAEAVARVGADGDIDRIIVKTGGSGYELNFAPKLSIFSSTGIGEAAAGRTLVNGIKDAKLINGGQGYNSYNPPVISITPPSDLINGSQAAARITVDDTTGQVSGIEITNSGSGYDFIPAISFINPNGAEISNPVIDSEGRLVANSISVVKTGLGYSNPPEIYIDPAPEDGINAEATCSVSPDGQVVSVTIINRGRGYLTAPRARIIQPVGAQVLDVTVANGNVTNINLLTGGSGYTDAPSVYIVDDRKGPLGESIGGTGAQAVATIFNGEITDINIVSFGSGYSDTEPPKVYIAEPLAAQASCDVGFGEVTGFNILSGGRNYEPSSLRGCARGVSDVVEFDNYGNQVYAPESALSQTSHSSGSVVHNLDSQIIREVFDKFRRQYMPTIQIDYSQVNPIRVIRDIKDFYLSKGTKVATQYLFKILFGEEIDVFYPKDEMITPSAASWVVDTILRAELISGDPVNLTNAQLVQIADPVDQNIKDASVLIENVISIIEGTDVIYELAISEETLSGEFKIPYKTVLVEPLDTTEGIITVDSTIGWPEKNGTIIIDDQEVVQYKDKSLNQFIECTRSKNGVVEDWDPGTTIHSDIFVYVNKGLSTEVKLRILGIAEAATTVLEDSGSYYLPGDKLNVAALGSTADDQRLQSWLYNVKKLIRVNRIEPGGLNRTATVTCSNPHGLLVEDAVTIYGANPAVYNGTFEVTARLDEFTFSYLIPVPTDIEPQGNILLSVDLNRGKSTQTTIDEVISLFTSNVQNTFFNNDYVYVAASGLPNYKIGPFQGSALIPGNQRKLLRFPRTVNTVSTRTTVKPNTPIGAWVNGVAAWSYKDQEYVTYGPVTGINITDGGIDYDAGSKPQLEITGGGGSGATAEVIVNGALSTIEVTNQGSGYTSQPLISIVGGGGSGATAQAVVTNGRVTRVLVGNPGTGYTAQPTISITGGGGSGATATAQVRGKISGVTLTARGSGYTSTPSIKLNSGEGALAQPIVINGRIVSIAIINSGSAYTTAPTVYINGDGFGAQAKAVIGTLGEDKGKVISIQITNRGVGYTQGNTTVRLEAVGQLATFEASVFQWNKNVEYELNNKYDVARGYVFTGFNNQYGGEYAHVSDPKELRYVVGDNVILNPENNQFIEEGTETGASITHSPIIGWAFDGNPIYGPYGYIDPTDQNGGIRRMRSSYKLKANVVYDIDTNPNPARVDGPPLSEYAAGQFIDDYEYTFQEGDLDQYNGRFCKTPEYPDGIYAYFITIDASEAGLPVFPYIIGPEFNSVVDTWNISLSATQENIPADVSRYRDPYEDVDIDIDRQPNQQSDQLVTEKEGFLILFETEDIDNDGIISPNEIATQQAMTEEAALQIYDYFPRVSTESRVDIEVETTTKFENAQIDGFVIENPGVSYQVTDTLFFDNTGTDGFGASAQVESVQGAVISQYRKEVINDIPYGKITTETDHELIAQDEVIVSSRVITENTNKRFYMSVVTGIDSIDILQSGIGYNEAIPPTYEIITTTGQDVELDIDLDLTTGKIDKVNIINSGFNYDTDLPPQIRVSHPQKFKKTYYWSTIYSETQTNCQIKIHDSAIADDRNIYVCGELIQPNGDSAAFLAKYNDLGSLVWDRSLLPSASIKTARWKKMYLDQTSETNHLIYLIGETESQGTANYNPDILVAKYESGLDNANNPEGLVRFQKEIAGVSGTTRRDYAGDIYLDEEQRVYICGWTDTNSPDPDDIWVMQLNNQGDIVEKRKFASDAEGEQMHQLYYLGDNQVAFCGIDEDNNDLLFGIMEYDGANIELQYVKRLAISGGDVQRPQFVLDEYNDLFFVCDMWNGTKNYGVAFFKIALDQIRLTVATPEWNFAKIMAPTVNFESIKHAGITVDVFGNVNVVTNVVYEDNDQQAVITGFKYDGTTLYSTNVIRGQWNGASSDTGVGFTVNTHNVDNSGDILLPLNLQDPIQEVVHRFENATLTFDDTKQNKSTISVYDGGAVSQDSSVFKFGANSLNLADANYVKWTDLNLTEQWTNVMWVRMAPTHGTNNPRIEMITAKDDAGSTVQYIMNLDSGDGNFGKIALVIAPSGGSTTTVWSIGSTYATTLADSDWHHIALVKEEPSLGSYVYSCYFDGVNVATATVVDEISMNDLVVGGQEAGPLVGNSFVGNIDDIVVESRAVYSGSSLQVPTERYRITTQDSALDLVKFDRLHSKRGDYNTTFAGYDGNYTESIAFTANTTLNANTLSNPVITVWNEGPSGLQILDFSDVVSTLAPGTYTFSTNRHTYSTKTSTIPTPLGRKLKIEPVVLPKYYIRDAGYQKIDAVREFTFNQDVKFEKGSIIQQYNENGVVQAYGTIVETPVGGVNTPGLGTNYKIGKIYGTFNSTDLFKNDKEEENTIDEISFTVKRSQDAWESGKAYSVNDQVWSDGKIYFATNNATSGATAPTHEIGIVTDGAVLWSYISAAPNIEVDLADFPWPAPTDPEWIATTTYVAGDIVFFGRNKYQCATGGVSGTVGPTHTTGSAADGSVTWNFVSTYDPLSDYARFRPFTLADYRVTIVNTYAGSDFIIGDVVSLGNSINAGPKEDTDNKIAEVSGLGSVKEITLTVNLNKDIIRTADNRTDLIYCSALTPHNFTANDILFVEGFTTAEFNGSFFVKEVFSSRDFTYKLRATATADPAFAQGAIARVKISSKHPTLLLVRNHSYIFDMSDVSNFGYYLSFAQDNQYKLEYSFNVIEREGTPGLSSAAETPVVKFTIGGEVTNITYYFDPSRTGATSPVGSNSFIDVIKTPYDGRFKISEILSDTEFRFPLLYEPEFNNAEIGLDDQDKSNTIYSTTSKKAIGPINSIKLISPGGFYKKLPIISDIASDRKIEKLRILSGGTEYAPGVYTQVPILGDGEGGLCNITVENDDIIGSGTVTNVALTDPGKGYTFGSIDIDAIQGILGPTLSGSGAEIEVVIPAEGTGAAVFLTGRQIGKIKTLKNNEFGYGYSHDYTLRPEIAFPINLQLFNTSILSQITITNPGAGYTSAPAVIIQGGGGTGAEAEAVVKNNRLSEILIKNPGAGYSSQPEVTLKSEFTYVVNLDLNYLQFNFPHGITTGAEVQFRADAIGSTVGELPKPSSVGLTSLSAAQTYYAIAGEVNGLESDQLRFALTPVDAESGNFITFLTQGAGRQVLLTEVFGGQAEAVVETSRFLEGEIVFQGETQDLATATGIVSINDGWQIEPKILKVTNPKGDFVVGGKVQGVISRASGVIDNINIAKGVLNIDAITKTAGRFTDDVGKPSEIVQKIQDSFFYQNFSYVIKSEIPINRWKSQILQNNHPVGFNLFGQLSLTGGKDISGRKVAADFTKQVNINEYTNVNEITSFGAAQPIYSTFNNSEVLFRKKRLTNSEEILTSIVKKIDDISDQFDGARKNFPLTVEGQQVIVKDNQLLVTINGVIQSPGNSYQVVGNQIVFSEAPRPDSKVVYRNIRFDFMPITRLNLNNIAGIFPSIGDNIFGFETETSAKVVATGATSIDVVDISGSFALNERVDVGRTGFSALIGSIDKSFTKLYLQSIGGAFGTSLIGDIIVGQTTGARATITSIDLTDNSVQVTDMSNGFFDRGEDINFFTAGYGANILNVDSVNYKTIFEFGETVTNMNGDTAIIEGSNLDLDGNISDALVLSKTSGTAEFETGQYNLFLNDIFYSAASNIAARITSISPYRDPIVSINLVRPVATGAWSTMVEGDKFEGLTSGATGEVVKIDFEASPPVMYYLKSSETDLTDGETVQGYTEFAGVRTYTATTETVSGEVRLGDVVDTLVINQGSTFFGMIFERLISLTNQNVILDDISKTTITPVEILNSDDRVNADFLDFEEVRSTEIEYENLTGGTIAVGDVIRSITVTYGNPVTDALNRWFDAANRIAANKQEIVDFANAEIAVQHPGFYYPGDNQTDQFSRYADAYRLIHRNKDYIIAKSYEDMTVQYPSLPIPSPTKCQRDIGHFIDAISMDMFQGGTVYTRKFLQMYFSDDGLTFLYINNEAEATEYAFEQALGYMKNALTNMLTGTDTVGATVYNLYDERSTGGSSGTGITADPSPGNPYGTAGSNSVNYGATNCSDVQSALQTLFDNVSEVLLAGSLSDLIELSEPSTYSSNETKCRRDIGYFVDALVQDIKGDGNYGIVKFTRFYFDASGTPISNGLVGETAESITAFNKARDMAKRAINNLLYDKDLTLLYDPTTYPGPYLTSSSEGHTYDPNYSQGNNQDAANCADVQAALDTLTAIATTAINAGNLNNINALSVISDGSFQENENLRVYKISYKDPGANGLFLPGETVRGVTSGANFTSKGTNAGLKWLFTDSITGTFQNREYITNSRLTANGTAVLTGLEYKSGTKSLRLDAGAYLSHTLSDVQKFGTENFTIEMWIRPTTISGIQYLFDTRTSGTSENGSPVLYLNGSNIAWWYNGSDQISAAHGLGINTWHHVAVTRTTNITKIWVNGSQVGGDYTDNNNYLERAFTIGADLNGASGFVGHLDNIIIKKGVSDYSQTFTPGFTFPTDNQNISFSMSMELPLIISNEERYATYTGQTNSSATAKSIDYDEKTIIVEDINLARDEYRKAADMIELNLDWIAEVAVGLMKEKYPDFVMPGDSADGTGVQQGTNFCLRDTKEYILKAVIEDMRYGGNYNSVIAGRGYLTKQGGLNYVGNELLQSIFTWTELAVVINYVITTTSSDLVNYNGTKYTDILRIPNNFVSPASQAIQDEVVLLCDTIADILGPTGNRFRDAGDLIWKNRDYIAYETVGWLNDYYSAEINDTQYDFLDIPGYNGNVVCARDIKEYILPAVITDLITGGNSATQYVIDFYINNNNEIIHVENELGAMLDAFSKVKELVHHAVNNTLLSFGTTASELGAASDLQDDYYVAQFTEIAAYRDTTITIDSKGYNYQDIVSNYNIDAANMLEANKHVIAKEAVYTMNDLSKYLDLAIPGGSKNCEDDVMGVIDAVIHDLRFGGNSATYDAALLYLNPEDDSLLHIEQEAEAAIDVYKIAMEICILTMRNGFGRDNLYIYQAEGGAGGAVDPGGVGTSSVDAVDVNTYEQNAVDDRFIDGSHIIERNIRLIAEEAVAQGLAQFPGLTIPGGNINCVHDVTDVLHAMVWNLRYGGNNKMFRAAEFYVNNGSLAHISSQATESTWIFNKARDLAITVMRDQAITITAGHGYTQKFNTDLDFFPYNQGGYVVTADTENPGSECPDVASAITDLFTVITDTLATPTNITDGTITKTLPNCWPVKYAPEMVVRDTTVTYDAGASNWNETCPQTASTIETLFDIVINTISEASAGNASHLAGITRDAGYNSNTEYQFYTCYDVTSAAETLFDMMLDTLGGGSNSDRSAARRILFNRHAISAKAFSEVQTAYPTTVAEESFGDALIGGLLYDLNTGGNQGVLRIVNTWFDGEGNFIAFPDVTKQHLLWFVTRISEYCKRALDDYNDNLVGGEWYGYDIYLDPTHQGTNAIENRYEYEMESTQFKIDASLNAAYFAISRGTPPTQNKIQWTNNIHATNNQNLYDEGVDWNTDPDLIINTPTVEVGFERRENKITINRPNFYSRGDILSYVVASEDVEAAFADQEFFYVLNATPSAFEITKEIRHDARFAPFAVDLATTGQQQLQLNVRSGITRMPTTYGTRDIDNPISGGFSLADVVVGSTSNASSEIVRTRNNEANIIKIYQRFNIGTATGRFNIGERVQVQGAGTNYGTVLQTSPLTGDNEDEGWIYVENITGTFSVSDILEGIDSAQTAEVTSAARDRMLINTERGSFGVDEMFFNKGNGAEADIVAYENSAGSLTSNTGGRIAIDIETLQDDFIDGDIIYGSITDKILNIANITRDSFRDIELNQYVHAVKTIECDVNTILRDQGFTGDFKKGDFVYLLQGSIPKIPGWTAVVTDYLYDPDNSIHKIWIANLQPYGAAADGTTTVDPNELLSGGLGKFENLNNFPVIQCDISNVTVTNYTSYGKVSGKSISGDTGRIWLEDVVGDFPSNLTIISDYGWSAGVTQSKNLLARCDRYFRGFDGTETSFKLTISNGEAYFPDPAGHLLVFVNGVLQPPGANYAYTAFSDSIQFTEPPTVGSEFIGYYVGKLRQLDDISFEFDSLRSSFNLKYQGGFYSLTLTEGVSSNTILPENNIIVSLNGVIQEPGVGYELVGSRIIFAEIPRAGSTFVAFSYIGSDADVIAATVVPPIEAGDILQIEGEADEREVALIESSNSLITFEYTGTVKGRGASALASIKSGEITEAIITSPGDGYTSRPSVDVISATGFDGRVRALMGILRIDVKTPGIGYAQPAVAVETIVDDDFVPPTGPAVNQGFDTYAGEGTDAQGNPIVIVPGYIQITSQPVNVTVNQGQTAEFTVVAAFIQSSDNQIGTTALNYQWQRKQYGETDWNNITGQTSNVYDSNSAAQADDGDEFRVAITAAGATPVYSNSVILTVQTGATVISNFNPTQIFQ
ncbi:virion structural protein [Synechococcus phage S-WAM1]|uniref:Baseplate wedge initiator n=1 Tax=Synechococcus phage S-WAM1 TaxID=1815521 RepID=A0A1D8KSA0_9CAUD|nr:virion structural protein [Synechococcus phage S-WAM1]AOV61558.1 baseplate wedge initiator [Synechococcus phage S-WAM1]